jgi:REP element-mobilizing transposase RayT
MPNHVHLILTPKDADGLRRALAPMLDRFARFADLLEEGPGNPCSSSHHVSCSARLFNQGVHTRMKEAASEANYRLLRWHLE